jgi:D-alanyl-lipoteichoic acid acyltransferase DltB (MBOAT superfamily)
MPFTSLSYLLLFLPVVVLAHSALQLLKLRRVAVWLLLGASLWFYAAGRPEQGLLLLASIVVNWAIAMRIGRAVGEPAGLRWLWLGIIANLAFLSAFKYINFFFAQFSGISGAAVTLPNWPAPLGISFFTFAQIMYLTDCYQEMYSPVGLLDHATSTGLFPYIAAGPIVRIPEISEQFSEPSDRGERWDMVKRGLIRLGIGFAKKVLLGDSLVSIVNVGFGAPSSLSTYEAWVVAFVYTLQIYFDFSGYTDMAVGSAMLLGIKIPENFNNPYIAKSVSEFWQRWHMSLSNFITNYLYTPIVRAQARPTLKGSIIAVLIAMGLCGLWHGANWTYVAWGLAHGAALGVNQYWRKSKRKLPRGLGWLVTLTFVTLALVLFRAPSLAVAGRFFAAMLPHTNLFGVGVLTPLLPDIPSAMVRPALLLLVVIPFAVMHLFNWRGAVWFAQVPVSLKVVAYSLMIYLTMFLGGEPTSFVYFQF